MTMWDFWFAQLAGENPETTPGTPHAGFYTNRRRVTFDNPEPGPGKPRKKIKVFEETVAIWQDESGWHCLIHSENGQRHLTDVDAIDEIFSRCCRTAITHEAYEARLQEFTGEAA